jgi:hypothetical protein
VIGRTSKLGKKEYEQMWIYVPVSLSTDSNFKMKVGDPVEITLDTESGSLSVASISTEEALERGWKVRKRSRR